MFKRFHALERAFEGAVAGCLLAGVAVLVGIARCAVFERRGGEAASLTNRDVEGLLLYAAGFIVAGAILGAGSPVRRFALGALSLGVVGAGIVFTAIAIAEDGLPRHWDSSTWIATTACTVIFGGALAYFLYDSRRRAA